ncbi:MAG: hypothetical protein CMD15_01500 [Flavobacteriales bacterium]|nr:hypothetical protein [Flavobacteriales bacterium]
MKRLILISIMTLTSVMVFGQKHNIVNASIALKNSNLLEAKQYIDEAYNNEKTSNEAKMWNYRSKIYLKISQAQYTDTGISIDGDAIFKASEAHIKCLQTNKRGKIIVRKWTSEEDVRNGLMQCALLLFNMGGAAYDAQEYNLALTYYNEILNILPYDNDGILNIKKENVIYNSVFVARALNDAKMSESLLQQLIDLDFNEPNIYVFMSESLMDQGNTDSALEYLSIGRAEYPSNEFLLNTEINLYIKLNKLSDLIVKFTEAIKLDPENFMLYFNRGTIYDQEGDTENAEKDYLMAIELNPSSFGANYNLGAMYFNAAAETINKANATSNNNTHTKLKKQAELLFAKALPYMEVAHQIDANDENTMISLKQLYYRNGDYAKSEEIKKKLEGLK